MKRFSPVLLLLGLLFGGATAAKAQWTTQSIALKGGWNAVFLHVDASHTTLESSVLPDSGNPITEVWLWAPPSATLQFVQSPQQPIDSSSQWVSWKRISPEASQLHRLIGNAAYLVYVSTNVANYTWTIKGKPVPPGYEWTTTGLNFLGFPTVAASAPSFESFLAQAPDLQQNAEVYQYPGGPLGAGNPARLYTFRTTPVRRGQAFWIRSGTMFNRYFGPFETVLNNPKGVDFADSLNVLSFRLRNLTASNLTVSLALLASETPPAGQTNIVGVPPLLLRGALNTTNLTYAYNPMTTGGTNSWTLAPQGQANSDVEVVIALNRSAMTGSVGALHAAMLRLSDSLGHSQVELPLTATVASEAGLWVGNALVTQVRESLRSYQRDSSGKTAMSTNGDYLILSTSTNLGGVPRSFPLRLIVHNPEPGGQAKLMQRAYLGLNSQSNSVVSTSESVLNRAFIGKARRLSASHLPWTTNNAAWSFDGVLGQSTNLTASVTLDYADQQSNPFLHAYHPDHDNLDPSFKSQLARGSESYTVKRDITLTVLPPADGVGELSAGGQTFSGNYAEKITVTGLDRGGGNSDSRIYEVRGVFTLNRISATPVLTQP